MGEGGANDDSFLQPPQAALQPYPPRALPPTNTKAVWSLILGVGSIVLAFCCGFLTGIPAIFLGLSAKRDVTLSGGAERGRGLAIGGIVTGIVGSLVSALLAGTFGIAMLRSDGSHKPTRDWKPPASSPAGGPQALKSFYGQKVHWTPCGTDKCARVTVPVDYDNPGGQTMSIAIKVIPSTEAGGRSLFLNPGGPGASGVEFADYIASKISPRVRARYDLVNVDPRGVGQSTPVDCLSKKAFAADAARDPDPDNATEIETFHDAVERFGKGCERRSGPVAAHISTEEAARDYDVLRALLGSDKLNWLGFSYGTQLGATYATLFPDRVGRMVLDGPVDPSLTTIEAGMAQTRGFQRALRAYVADCVRGMWCPLGRNFNHAMDKIANLLARLDKAPMRTDSHRKLTEGLAFYGIAAPLYSKANWVALSNAFDAAFQGDGSVLLRLADGYFNETSGEAFRAISCLDQRDHPTVDDIEAVEPDFAKASPVFGRALAWGSLSCWGWPIKPEHPQIDIDARTSAPILVVGTTRDPATPYEGAKALTKELGAAVLLTRVGDGHTAYAAGNKCITNAVDAYLLDGTMPAKGVVCR